MNAGSGGLIFRSDEAFAEIALAEAIDPLSLILNTDIGILLMLQRRYDEAIAQLQRTLDLGPDYLLAIEFLAFTSGLKGMFDACLEGYQKIVDLTGGSAESLAKLGYGQAIKGNRGQALRLAGDAKRLSKGRYLSPHYFAQLHSLLGNRDEALLWLEKSYEERSPWIAWLGVNPSYDWLREDSQFRDLLTRAGLPARQ